MSNTWVAEDLPAYMFLPTLRHPMTDENAAMSAPSYHARDVSEDEARAALSRHLHMLSHLKITGMNNDDHWYRAAALEIENGARMVRVRQRVFRLRNTTWCEKGRYHHGACEKCDPKDYAIFTRGEN